MPEGWVVHLLLARLFAVGPQVTFEHELQGDFDASSRTSESAVVGRLLVGEHLRERGKVEFHRLRVERRLTALA